MLFKCFSFLSDPVSCDFSFRTANSGSGESNKTRNSPFSTTCLYEATDITSSSMFRRARRTEPPPLFALCVCGDSLSCFLWAMGLQFAHRKSPVQVLPAHQTAFLKAAAGHHHVFTLRRLLKQIKDVPRSILQHRYLPYCLSPSGFLP
jgi:hypothetical protein